MEKPKSNIIQVSEVDELPDPTPSQTSRPFFPFFDRIEETKAEDVREAQRTRVAYPIVGLAAIGVAIFLIAFSGILLWIVSGPAKVASSWTVSVWHTDWTFSIPRPAALLSIILSFLGIALHVALSEGANVAWWFRAEQQDATVEELHELWQHGTSTVSVATTLATDAGHGISHLSRLARHATGYNKDPPKKWKGAKFTYVALASLFVASIPINAFLLQNAVSVKTFHVPISAALTIPMATAAEWQNLGLTAAITPGGMSSFDPHWGKLIQKITPAAISRPSVNLGHYNTSCPGSCTAVVKGLSFEPTCETNTVFYDMDQNPYDVKNPYYGSAEMLKTGKNILDVQVWPGPGVGEYSTPNSVMISALWKDEPTCFGFFRNTTCNLNLVTADYPVTIHTQVQGSGQQSTIMSLDMDLLESKPTKSKTTNNLEKRQGVWYPAYALVGYLGESLNSSVTLTYNQDNTQSFHSIRTTGSFGSNQLFGNSNFSLPSGSLKKVCTGSFGDVFNQLSAQFYSIAFQVSVLSVLQMLPADPASLGTDPKDDIKPVEGQATIPQNQYVVYWKWYFASLGVTLLIALAISPTYWGFWSLSRKTTMSPFETARAFFTPVTRDAQWTDQTKDVLSRVRSVRIHQDIPSPA